MNRAADLFVCFIAALFIITLAASYSMASPSSDEVSLAGSPFLKSSVLTMPKEWHDQPFEYEDWAKGAALAVVLDQHLYAVLLPVVQRYAREHNVDIAVKEGTCGISAGVLLHKSADMAGFCCPPGASDRLPGLEYHTVGIAPLAIVVNSENPVQDMTDEEVRGLFMGKIKNWSELGGGRPSVDMPVRPVTRLHCKARPGHWRLILDNEDLFAHSVQEVGTIPDMVQSVASYKGAVGHLATWNIHAYADRWQVRALRINGISPSNGEALKKVGYPYYRAYNIATWSGDTERARLARDLISYIMRNMGEVDPRFDMVPAGELRKAGWKFDGDELVGEPD